MFRSALLILSGNAFGSLMMLVRNLLVARLVSVEDYGIAATFAISMAIVEMMSTLGLQQLIVQDTKGNDPKLQAGLQGFHLMRSVFSAGILFALAHPIAQFLGIPEVAWAYQVLAIVPLLNGFTHFDIYRLQRQMNFRPSILSVTIPAFLSLLCVWPLFEIFGDFQVMLYALLLQHITTVIASHVFAERAYHLSFDRAVIVKSLIFGWPLLVNNILMFAVFQGDKVIVGREFGIETLAIFAMGFTLTLTPTLVMAKSAQSFFLPQLSAVKDQQSAFQDLSVATIQCHVVFALFLVVGITLLGAPFVQFALGDKYAAVVPILTWLAIMQGIRVSRSGSTTAALAKAHTQNAMIANMVRVSVLPLVWYVAATQANIILVIWIGILAELVSACVSLGLLYRRTKLSLSPVILPSAFALLFLAVTGLQAQNLSGNLTFFSSIWGSVLSLLFLGLCLITMKELRLYIRQRVTPNYGD